MGENSKILDILMRRYNGKGFQVLNINNSIKAVGKAKIYDPFPKGEFIFITQTLLSCYEKQWDETLYLLRLEHGDINAQYKYNSHFSRA